MTIKQQLSTYPVKEVTYYQLHMWEDKTTWGVADDRLYKTKANAQKRMAKLIASGKYQMVTMRKEEIWLRDDNNEFSASGLEESWEVTNDDT